MQWWVAIGLWDVRGCKDQMAPHKSLHVTESDPSVWHHGAVAHGRRLSYVE